MTSTDNDINEEIQSYPIQILDAILHHSFAAPLPEDHDHKESKLNVHIQITIHKQQAQALLFIESIIIDDQTNGGYGLRFGILGSFQAPEVVSQENLGEFAKMHSLSFLWPYAREYSSSLIRRMSINAPPLPIINPQTMTPKLIENELVKVQILTDDQEENV